MKILPAYDESREQPCILIDFVKSVVFHPERPASYGRQFESKRLALVSYEDGSIAEVNIEDLTITWDETEYVGLFEL